MFKTLSFLIILSLTGCARIITINSTFSESDTNWILKNGNNKITGQGFMTTVAGDIKLCSGKVVKAFPVTAYSKERISSIYGSENGGYSPFTEKIKITGAPSGYKTLAKSTICDAQGNFEFNNLPFGEYYVQTRVVWAASVTHYHTNWQGGYITKRVALTKKTPVQKVLLSL